jgi:hypothetical protein
MTSALILFFGTLLWVAVDRIRGKIKTNGE